MKRVHWGVISTSSYARARIVPAMMMGKNLTVSAIASRNLAKAQKAADALGIATAYGSYQEVLDDPDIEAVYLPLPNHLHVPWAIKAAEAGKHVLCEKPIAMNAAEAETLIEVQARTGKLIQEAFMVLTHPQMLRARELIGEGRIGELRAVHAFLTWTIPDPTDIRMVPEFGGGILYDGGCYAITTARFLFGAEPLRAVMLVDPDPANGVDRTVSALVEFPSGQASFVASQALVYYQRIQILGTEGRIDIEVPFDSTGEKPCNLFLSDSTFDEGTIAIEAVAPVDQYTLQAELFSEAVRNGTPQPVPLENSIGNMRAIDALFRSAKSGGWESIR
jgi:predicted dehydrogenase